MEEQKKRNGRPPIEIDMAQLEELAAIQCTEAEIAAVMGIGRATIERKLRIPEYREAFERGKARGRASLRRMQFKLAQDGNPALCIWLGKQLLGQREMVGLSDPEGGPIKVERSQDELLARIADMARRIGLPETRQIDTIEITGVVEDVPPNGGVK